MSIEGILDKLLAEVPGAVGVSLLDDTGESIQTTSRNLPQGEMSTIGTLAEIQLRQLCRLLEAEEGERGTLVLEAENLSLLARQLVDGYVLVLTQRAPGTIAMTRRSLDRAALVLEQEVLG